MSSFNPETRQRLSSLRNTAREAELPRLVEMLADDALGATRERPGEPVDPAYRSAWDAIASDPNNELLVAEIGREIAAMMQLTFIPCLSRTGSWRCLVEGVRVAAGRRGQGLGSAMLRHAIERAEERGCGMVQLTSDKQRPEARRFYEALGFVASHEGFKLKLGPDRAS